MSQERFYQSTPFVEQEAYDMILQIYRDTYNRKEGPRINASDFNPASKDTFPDLMRREMIALELFYNGEQANVLRCLHYEKNCLIEVMSRECPLESEMAANLVNMGIPIKQPYRRIARLKAIGETHRFDYTWIDARLATYALHTKKNVPEDFMDLFSFERLAQSPRQ